MQSAKYWVTMEDPVSLTHMRVLVVPNRRRQRIGLFVRAGFIEVRTPLRIREAVWRAFLLKHWQQLYVEQQHARERGVQPALPEFCWVQGQRLACQVFLGAEEERIEWSGNALHIHVANSERCEHVWQAWCLERCMTDLLVPIERVIIRGQTLGLVPKLLRFKKLRSSWGICHARGDIHLATALWSVPFKLVDFVVCHELCHLRHMNHGREFYGLLAQLAPDHVRLNRELRAFGHVLRSGLE